MVEYLQPKRIIAIGNDAYNVLSGVFTEDFVYKARHPSYGGQTEFLTTMNTLYATQMDDCESDLFANTCAQDHQGKR